jgi:hypothetical protein
VDDGTRRDHHEDDEMNPFWGFPGLGEAPERVRVERGDNGVVELGGGWRRRRRAAVSHVASEHDGSRRKEIGLQLENNLTRFTVNAVKKGNRSSLTN